MLRMSMLADYGTVILVRMAREPARVMSAAHLAAETRLAAPTVSKVLKLLASRALVVASRGKNGGYLLTRQPDEISVADIIEAVDGPWGLTQCVIEPGACPQESSCAALGPWHRVSRALRGALAKITLDEMTDSPPPRSGRVEGIRLWPEEG
jgi:FeS assembly SUF system regulator